MRWKEKSPKKGCYLIRLYLVAFLKETFRFFSVIRGSMYPEFFPRFECSFWTFYRLTFGDLTSNLTAFRSFLSLALTELLRRELSIRPVSYRLRYRFHFWHRQRHFELSIESLHLVVDSRIPLTLVVRRPKISNRLIAPLTNRIKQLTIATKTWYFATT